MSKSKFEVVKVIVSIMCIFLVIISVLSTKDKNNLQQENNHINNNQQKNESEENLSDYEKKELDFKNRVDKLENILLELGYHKSKECYYHVEKNDLYCYTNGTFEVVNNQYIGVTFSKITNSDDLKEYNSKDDLAYIGKLLGYSELSSIYPDVNKIISMLSKDYAFFFAMNLNGLYINISNSSSYLSYRFDTGYTHTYDLFYLSEINSIVNDVSNKELSEVRKTLYDIAISNNKKLFSYYDYPYFFLGEDTANICRIDYNEKDGKHMSSSFCHGGTSNTYFKFEKGSDNYEYLEVSIKEKYFKDNYLEIIKRDLKYIGDKLEIKFELDDEYIDDIVSYIKNKDEALSISLNDKLNINIEFKYGNYYLKYIIK